jgi:hypothetical protein
MAGDSPLPPGKDSNSQQKNESDASFARRLFGLLGLGVQLALTVAAFAAAGWWADAHWGWAPWGKQSLGLVGIVVGLYFFVKEATK